MNTFLEKLSDIFSNDLNSTFFLLLTSIMIVIFIFRFVQEKQQLDQSMRLREREELLRIRYLNEKNKDNETPSPIRLLLQREDVTLRVLEEIYEQPSRIYREDWGSPESLRLRSLNDIQGELKEFLRISLQSTDFPQIRDRTLAILDQIRTEMERLQHKQPFNDIHDPEKALLIDIFQEIDSTHTIARQKVFQLANIIKIKHQDLLNMEVENARAAIWTKWGTAGTIIFGVLSLVMAIITFKS